MELCDRCNGGELGGGNCLACGGSGMVSANEELALFPPLGTAISTDLRRQRIQENRVAREREKRRPVKHIHHPGPRPSKEALQKLREEYEQDQAQAAMHRHEQYIAHLNALTIADKSISHQ